MRMHPGLPLALTLGLLTATAQSQTRGLLRYADGTVLPGILVDSSDTGGTVRSARFGDVRYTAAEARFEPAAVDSTVATEPVAAPAAPQAHDAPRTPWKPVNWSIGVSGYAQKSNGVQESDLAVDLDATWTTSLNDVNLRLAADYRINSDVVDNNEQSGRLRWVRSLSSPWIALGMFRAHRNTFTVAPLPTLDYLLQQGTLGFGIQKKWHGDGRTLVALGYDWLSVKVLDYNVRTSTHARSLLIENAVPLTPKINFDQTLYVYFWQGGDTGIDSVSEISYALTEYLRVGLKHELRRNAVDLDVGTFNKFSVSTRVKF